VLPRLWAGSFVSLRLSGYRPDRPEFELFGGGFNFNNRNRELLNSEIEGSLQSRMASILFTNTDWGGINLP
jgi:hypothetical protein